MKDEDALLISGIQHFYFCPRQWALIHVEQIWMDNVRTVEGRQLHERTDDPLFDESRGGVRVVRAMPLASKRLGLVGVADVVEFHNVEKQKNDQTSCRIYNHPGWWTVIPVEYKRGRPKADKRDAIQLCTQAMALEEMLNVRVLHGFLYYGETRRREKVFFTDELRQEVINLSTAMHKYISQGITPKAERGKKCSLCSLVNYCQPNLTKNRKDVSGYYIRMISSEGDT